MERVVQAAPTEPVVEILLSPVLRGRAVAAAEQVLVVQVLMVALAAVAALAVVPLWPVELAFRARETRGEAVVHPLAQALVQAVAVAQPRLVALGRTMVAPGAVELLAPFPEPRILMGVVAADRLLPERELVVDVATPVPEEVGPPG